jgi:glutathione S-transferase
MKLYHAPMTRSGRVRWLLGELGEPCEIAPVNVFVGEGRKPEYREIHPHGYVPALELDGDTLVESAAICLYLADKYAGKGLAPPTDSPLRAKYYQWMVYVPATCDPALETILFHTRFLPEERRIPVLVEQARKKWASCERFLSKNLADRTYIVGDTFTAADVMLGTALAWAKFAGALGEDPKLAAYLERMAARPAFQAAHDG